MTLKIDTLNLLLTMKYLLQQLDSNSVIYLKKETGDIIPHRVAWLEEKIDDIIIDGVYDTKQQRTMNELRGVFLKKLIKIYKNNNGWFN